MVLYQVYHKLKGVYHFGITQKIQMIFKFYYHNNEYLDEIHGSRQIFQNNLDTPYIYSKNKYDTINDQHILNPMPKNYNI